MADKEKLTPQQEHAEPTKETKEAQVAPDPEQKPAETPADDLLYKQYISKEDIEIDPETGKITEATRERILAALNEHAIDLEKQNGIFAEIEELAAAGVKKPKNINISKRNESAAEVVARRINAAVKDAATALTNAQKIADLIIKIAGALNVDTARDVLLEMRETFSVLAAMAEEITELEPYLNTELEKLNKPEYKGKTFYQVFYNNDYEAIDIYELYTDPESDLSKILAAARKAKEMATLQQIKYNKVTEIQTSTDNLTTMFYSLAAPKGKNYISGQREMLTFSKEDMIQVPFGKGQYEIVAYYDYMFNEPMLKKLGLDKDFDSYDFFITAAQDNLLLNGNSEVTLTKLWKELGNTTSPNPNDLTKLYKRLVRGLTTVIVIDDKEVQEAWGNNPGENYKEIISPVMPIQIVGDRIISDDNNDKVKDAKINITGFSPFFALSQSIGQYTTWKKEILSLYTGRKTPRYYNLMRYLMTQIAWLRNPNSKRSNKITYSSIYDCNGDKTTRAKQLSRDMAYRLLDEVFKPAGYVKSYKEDNKGQPGIKLSVTKNTAALSDKKNNGDVV